MGSLCPSGHSAKQRGKQSKRDVTALVAQLEAKRTKLSSEVVALQGQIDRLTPALARLLQSGVTDTNTQSQQNEYVARIRTARVLIAKKTATIGQITDALSAMAVVEQHRATEETNEEVDELLRLTGIGSDAVQERADRQAEMAGDISDKITETVDAIKAGDGDEAVETDQADGARELVEQWRRQKTAKKKAEEDEPDALDETDGDGEEVLLFPAAPTDSPEHKAREAARQVLAA